MKTQTLRIQETLDSNDYLIVIGCTKHDVLNAMSKKHSLDPLICVDADDLDPRMFYKTVVPQLQMTQTKLVLCCKNSPDDNHWISLLMNLKDHNGNDFFVTVQ